MQHSVQRRPAPGHTVGTLNFSGVLSWLLRSYILAGNGDVPRYECQKTYRIRMSWCLHFMDMENGILAHYQDNYCNYGKQNNVGLDRPRFFKTDEGVHNLLDIFSHDKI